MEWLVDSSCRHNLENKLVRTHNMDNKYKQHYTQLESQDSKSGSYKKRQKGKHMYINFMVGLKTFILYGKHA